MPRVIKPPTDDDLLLFRQCVQWVLTFLACPFVLGLLIRLWRIYRPPQPTETTRVEFRQSSPCREPIVSERTAEPTREPSPAVEDYTDYAPLPAEDQQVPISEDLVEPDFQQPAEAVPVEELLITPEEVSCAERAPPTPPGGASLQEEREGASHLEDEALDKEIQQLIEWERADKERLSSYRGASEGGAAAGQEAASLGRRELGSSADRVRGRLSPPQHGDVVYPDLQNMTGPFKEIQVRLHRDAINTQWGFRLQGGKDFKVPLTVQRVFVGSPAEGDLQRGDVILTIDNNDTTHMAHKRAMEIIRSAGGSLSMRIKRGPRPGAVTFSTEPPLPNPHIFTPSAFRSRPFDTGPGSTLSPGLPPGTLGFLPKPRPQMAAPRPTPSYGVDYSHPKRYGPKTPHRATYPDSMLNRLNKTLTNAIWTPGGPEDEYDFRSINDLRSGFERQEGETEEDYQRRSVRELKQVYNKPNEKSRRRRPISAPPDHYAAPSTSKPVWKKPEGSLPGGLQDPGWSPGMGLQDRKPPQQGGWAPVRGPGSYGVHVGPVPNPYNQPAPAPEMHRSSLPSYQRPSKAPQVFDEGPPAWRGTLKSSGAPRLWEKETCDLEAPPAPAQAPAQAPAPVQPHQPRVQNVHYGPGDSAPQYSQNNPAEPADNAQVVHLQYNTPVGLYSRDNVNAALHGQTSGKPGEGTMQVSGGGDKQFDPSKSSVYGLILAEEDATRRRSSGNQSARYQAHDPGQEMNYQAYVDHTKKSPSMAALEAFVGGDGGESGDFGFSDF